MILSGLVLPLGVFSRNDRIESIKGFLENLFGYTPKRYFRLLPAIAITVLFCYILLFFNCYKTQEVAMMYNLDDIGNYFNFSITIEKAFFDAFIGAFISRPELNTPLWTIKYEFLGAIVTYGMVLIFKDKKYRYVVYGSICVLWYLVTHDIYFPCIVVGMMMSDYFFGRDLMQNNRFNKKVIMVLCVAIALLGYIPVLFNVYSKYFRMIFAIAIIVLLIFSQKIQRIFSNGVWIKFSEYSYELYAIHWIIICSLSCNLMIIFAKNNYYIATTLVFAITIIVTVIGAAIVKKLVFLINNLCKN